MGCSSSQPAQGRAPEPRVQGLGTPPPPPPGLPPRVKLVLLGDSGVGKSAIVMRYVKDQFEDASNVTVGAAFVSHSTSLPDGRSVKFEIWDTAGQERYMSLAPLYYRGAHAAAVVFSITSHQSFSKAKYWIKELQKNASGTIVIVLVGNKTDMHEQREVSEEDARAFADSNSMAYVETSAKTPVGQGNVREIFESIASKLAGGLPVSSNAAFL